MYVYSSIKRKKYAPHFAHTNICMRYREQMSSNPCKLATKFVPCWFKCVLYKLMSLSEYASHWPCSYLKWKELECSITIVIIIHFLILFRPKKGKNSIQRHKRTETPSTLNTLMCDELFFFSRWITPHFHAYCKCERVADVMFFMVLAINWYITANLCQLSRIFMVIWKI